MPNSISLYTHSESHRLSLCDADLTLVSGISNFELSLPPTVAWEEASFLQDNDSSPLGVHAHLAQRQTASP